jgi:hypothetical protein
LAVHRVPVVVHVHEAVVGADLLELGVGGEERPVVPEANVLDRGVVPLEVRRAEVLVRRKLLLGDAIEPVGQLGVL